jgi:hypothetical protein
LTFANVAVLLLLLALPAVAAADYDTGPYKGKVQPAGVFEFSGLYLKPTTIKFSVSKAKKLSQVKFKTYYDCDGEVRTSNVVIPAGTPVKNDGKFRWVYKSVTGLVMEEFKGKLTGSHAKGTFKDTFFAAEDNAACTTDGKTSWSAKHTK